MQDNILNDVVLNQVLVSFGDTLTTLAVIKNPDGTRWCGATWQGKTAMRISVSSWSTTELMLIFSPMLKAADEADFFKI
jgi:hypothetical protein